MVGSISSAQEKGLFPVPWQLLRVVFIILKKKKSKTAEAVSKESQVLVGIYISTTFLKSNLGR